MARTLSTDRLDATDVLGVEQPFRARLANGRRLAGFADLVLRRGPDCLEIVDHKVTRYARTAEDLAGDRQLNLYGWFAQRQWPWATQVLASHHYPVLDRAVTVALTDASMHATLDTLDGIAARAEQDRDFDPKPGPECASCPWIARCPAHQPATPSGDAGRQPSGVGRPNDRAVAAKLPRVIR